MFEEILISMLIQSSVSQGEISQSMIRGGITPPHLQENFHRCIKFDDST